ncbi:ATP-binding protein, partial [bacterium]|nr:ATP-binding protein [bacterium]
MKVERVNNEISKSENFEQKTFSIKVCAKAFDIFSSKLYSDIHMAIIRELSANAWDSHCQAGKEKVPFHVHLPNTLEPFFSIRDFGTGLSHEDVMTLYTTYFESTKTETNDQVGSFGLGSKSPYAYTDNFTVTSFFNGKKTIYSMFKGEEGFPVVAVLNQTETEEDNGLEILMASKTK